MLSHKLIFSLLALVGSAFSQEETPTPTPKYDPVPYRLVAIDCLPTTLNTTSPFSVLGLFHLPSSETFPTSVTAVGSGASLLDWVAESAVEGGITVPFGAFDAILSGLGTETAKAVAIVDGDEYQHFVCKTVDPSLIFRIEGGGNWDCVSKFACE